MSNTRGTLFNFLPLVPVTSNSYPTTQTVRPVVEGATRNRRASSISSNGQSASGFRVLKVAPVHFGEHSGDHQEDWHDVHLASPPVQPLLTFLSLSPVTSNSYPKAQEVRYAVSGAAPKRRTSSLSSDGKSGFRVLKVAPVHYGEHRGDHQEDWHDVPEVAVE